MPKYNITAEFWIDCCKCGCETVIVGSHPRTHRSPQTKAQAWDVAKAQGWTGTGQNPICPICPNCTK